MANDKTNIKEIIINALELYDNKAIKYYEYINNKIDFISHNKINFYSNDGEILKTTCELCGYYDTVNSIWIWAWLLPIANSQVSLARELLNYGLSLDVYSSNNEQIFIKNLLLNSRYIVNDQVGMDINLAIISFILKEKILFIYPHKNDQIIKYYLIIEN